MSSPFVGEIRMFAGNFPPVGWAFCNGALMAISENDTLFNLIGTTYGGDGQSTFALPNLQSRVPVHVGPGFAQGQTGGAETVTLTTNQIPAHGHVPQGAASGSQTSPVAGLWGSNNVTSLYAPGPASVAMAQNAVGAAGGSQPHDNMLPFVAVNFIISLFGIFPTQS